MKFFKLNENTIPVYCMLCHLHLSGPKVGYGHPEISHSFCDICEDLYVDLEIEKNSLHELSQKINELLNDFKNPNIKNKKNIKILLKNLNSQFEKINRSIQNKNKFIENRIKKNLTN